MKRQRLVMSSVIDFESKFIFDVHYKIIINRRVLQACLFFLTEAGYNICKSPIETNKPL